MTSTPSVPTSFVSDSGTAVPVANVLNVLGTNGVTTAASGNTLTVSGANRKEGTVTTIGAVTSNVISIPLGTTPGVYTFDITASGFDSAGPLGVGYTLVGAVRTTGAAAVLIPGQVLDEFEESAAIDAATIDLAVSGNNALITATGVAGLTINWKATALYTFVS